MIDGQRKYEHRHVAEHSIGRRLQAGEHVHHKDKNGLNNSTANLEVINARDHGRLHMLERYTVPWLNLAKEMLDAGKSFSDIAKHLGIPYRDVWRPLTARGFIAPKHYYPVSIDVDLALKMLSEGYSLRAIGKAIGMSHGSVAANLIKAGHGDRIPPRRTR